MKREMLSSIIVKFSRCYHMELARFTEQVVVALNPENCFRKVRVRISVGKSAISR